MKNFLASLLMLAAFTASASEVQAKMPGLFTAEQRPQEWCLAQNIYYEARGSNRADRIAVADVVLNRVRDSRYPNTVCEVVQQGPVGSNGLPRRDRCQFSWWCDGKSDWPTDIDAWIDAQQIAYNIMTWDAGRGLTEGATHYHADYVTPDWARSLQLVGRIGVHIFYRWE